MSNKSILRVAIIICTALLVFGVGMYITNDYSINLKNFIVGSVVSIIISLSSAALLSIADGVLNTLPKELIEDDVAEVIEGQPKTLVELEEIVAIDSLVGNMSDDEFYLFLSKDRYGGDKPDKEAILNLLEQIKGLQQYESKEKIIYKKLQEIK